MNKELINKYKPEFDHWLNEGSVLVKYVNRNQAELGYKDWHEDNDVFDSNLDYLIIINDEYVEFRKALTEGKTIQLNEAEKFADSNRGWVDLSCKSFGKSTHLFPINYYRIKPDEPKFKVGDFVTPLNREINCSVWQIDKVLSCNTVIASDIMIDLRTIQLWTPVKDEWCWFYDNKDNKSAAIAQFKTMQNDWFMSNTTSWNFCEPFLNSLPSYLKDK